MVKKIEKNWVFTKRPEVCSNKEGLDPQVTLSGGLGLWCYAGHNLQASLEDNAPFHMTKLTFKRIRFYWKMCKEGCLLKILLSFQKDHFSFCFHTFPLSPRSGKSVIGSIVSLKTYVTRAELSLKVHDCTWKPDECPSPATTLTEPRTRHDQTSSPRSYSLQPRTSPLSKRSFSTTNNDDLG